MHTILLTASFKVVKATNNEFEFDKTTVGAVFEPYSKMLTSKEEYTKDEVKTMLETVSGKFQMISTYGIGALPGKQWNESEASGLIPLVAAEINQKLGKLGLTANIGIYQHSDPSLLDQEIKNAFDSAAIANKLFNGTVSGLILTSHFTSSETQINVLHELINKIQVNALSQSLKLGVRSSNCEQLASKSISSAFETVAKNLIKRLDFIICHKMPSRALSTSDSAKRVAKYFEDSKNNFIKLNENIKTYGETGWPSKDLSKEGVEGSPKNMKEFWFHASKWSKEKDFPLYIFTAFDEPWKEQFGLAEAHFGWWMRIRNDSDGVDQFLEKILYKDPKINSTEAGKDKEKSENRPVLPVQPEKSHTLEILLGLLGALVVIGLISGILVMYKKLRDVKDNLLTQAEIYEFERGLPESKDNADGQVEYALRLPYDRNYEIPKSMFIIDEQSMLGSGAFGTVYKGRVVNDESEVAFKMTKPHCSATNLKSLLSEIKIMIHVGKHPNVVSIIGAYTGEMKQGKIIIAMEICSGGSLEKYLRSFQPLHYQNDPSFSGNQVDPRLLKLLIWSYQIACGMEHIASKNVIHADLATRNVLLACDESAKITDFGLSRRLYEHSNYVKQNQEPLPWRWMALESLLSMEFSTKSDVWSYGVTLWEIFSFGEIPFPGMAWTVDFTRELKTGLRMSSPNSASPEIYELMHQCWKPDPVTRPNFQEIKYFFRTQISATSDSYFVN